MMLACQVVRTIAGCLVADACEPPVGDFEHGHLAEQSTAPHNSLAGQHGNSKAFERDVCLWCSRLYRSSVRRMPCAMRDLQSARVAPRHLLRLGRAPHAERGYQRTALLLCCTERCQLLLKNCAPHIMAALTRPRNALEAVCRLLGPSDRPSNDPSQPLFLAVHFC